MTLNDFVSKYNNTYVEVVDPTNKNQCMDLVIRYCMDVLGTDSRIFAGLLYAYQIFENPTESTSKKFDFIKNTAFGVPKAGDIIVWSKGYNNTAGHTAIVTEASISSFKAFAQNDPIGSRCIIKTYMYNNILGWLRQVTPSEPLEDIEKLKQKIADLEATEKRLIEEHKKAIGDVRRECEQKVAAEKSAANLRLQSYKDKILEAIKNTTI